jgi:hypothetical protein
MSCRAQAAERRTPAANESPAFGGLPGKEERHASVSRCVESVPGRPPGLSLTCCAT